MACTHAYSAFGELEEYASALKQSLEELAARSNIVAVVDPAGVQSWPPTKWAPLDRDGQRAQKNSRYLVREFWSRLNAIAQFLPEEVAGWAQSGPVLASRFARQRESPYQDGLQKLLKDALEDIDEHITRIRPHLYGDPEQCAIVPDTNAILKAGDFTRLAERYRKGLLVVPTSVVSELDNLKVQHRIETVRDKANKLIRQLKEFRRRGDVLDQVRITGQMFLRMLPYEPYFEGLPSWLDRAHSDDRFLAAALDYRRRFALAPVMVCTLDLNLQNKCALARMPFDDPDEEVLEDGPNNHG